MKFNIPDKNQKELATIKKLMEKITALDLVDLCADLRMFEIFNKDKYIGDEEDPNCAYYDFYIILQLANVLALDIEVVRDNLELEELIYYYPTEEEADKREYQIKLFKEVFKC